MLLETLVDGLKRHMLENRHLLLASCVSQGIHLDSYKPRTISERSVSRVLIYRFGFGGMGVGSDDRQGKQGKEIVLKAVAKTPSL